jgi:predicted dehydrogenase
MLTEGPETTLVGIWARRPEQAAELAAAHDGVAVFERYEALLEQCEAVALAVAPPAQPDLAVAAARAGRAVLLEKPLGLTLADAERVAGAVGEAGVGSILVLTSRFSDGTRAFVRDAAALHPFGGRASFVSGALLGGPYAGSPWRIEHGALLDIGPHAVDIVDAVLGPVVAVRAHCNRHGWVGLLLDHDGGASSEVTVCEHAPIDSITNVEVVGSGGRLFHDARAARGPSTWANLRADFARVARTGEPHECDAQRGLHLQRIVDQARQQLIRA